MIARVLLLLAAVSLLTGCASKLYPSVHWTGQLASYPEADCVRPALQSLEGVQQVGWYHKELKRFPNTLPENREDTYSVVARQHNQQAGFDLWIGQGTVVAVRIVYFKSEDAVASELVRTAISAIAKSCAMPDLEQKLHYEYRQDQHLVPDWSEWP